MKTETLRKQLSQKPFRPLVIETAGGTLINVDSDDYIRMSPVKPHLIVIFDEDGTLSIIEPADVTRIQVQ